MLFTDRRYKSVSMEAKVLYGLLLDRMNLSIRNGWLDEDGRVYIFFTLEDAIEFLGFGNVFTAHFVRKLAHFTEFAALGTSLRITFFQYKIQTLKSFIFTASGCLLVAICDESIQLITPGRACNLNDILLDFFGSLCALLLVSVILWVKTKQSDNKKGNMV